MTARHPGEPDDVSDDTLMQRVAQRDQKAFTTLLDRHLKRAVALAYRVTGNRAVADEIMQEAFLRVWNKAAEWQPTARVSTWLWRIVMNLSLDHMRRVRPEPLDDIPEPVDPAADPEQETERAALRRALNAAIADLPDRQAKAVRLCLVDGFSQSEAAEVMAVSESALEALLVRARRALRESLSAHAPDTTPERGRKGGR